MREYLFRGIILHPTIILNGWFYGDLIHFADGLVAIRQQETGEIQHVISETVGQFTGLPIRPISIMKMLNVPKLLNVVSWLVVNNTMFLLTTPYVPRFSRLFSIHHHRALPTHSTIDGRE